MTRILTIVCICVAASLSAQTMPPPADQQLAHDIFKQFVEIKSGFTTGSTTPIAEAAAARLRAAGFPTYGVQGFFLDRDNIPFHSSNESLGVTSFYEGQTFLYTLVKRLSTNLP